MGRLSRQKGASFERWVAEQFRAAGFSGAKRGLSQSRDGAECPDVVGVPWLWIETKHRKSISLPAAMQQAAVALESSDSRAGAVLVVAKWDRQEPTATMYFGDFLDLLGELKALRALERATTAHVSAGPEAPLGDIIAAVASVIAARGGGLVMEET